MASVRVALPLAAVVCVSSLLMSGGVAGAALSSANTACRDAIAKTVVALEDTILNEQIKCHQARSRGVLDAGVDCSDPDDASFPGAAAVAKRAAQLAAGVATKCAKASAPAANGYASCASPCDVTVPAISSYNDVAACLICQTKDTAADAMRTIVGFSPPVQGAATSAEKCQDTYVGKGLRTFVKKRLTEQRKCQLKEDKGTIGATDCRTADLTGAVAKALAKLQASVAKCTDADLAALTSCASTVAAEQVCVSAAGISMADGLFVATYPEPTTSDGCVLNDNTTSTSTVNPAGCAVLARDTSGCDAARAAAGLSGYWRKFSCRVTLSQGAGGVTAVADGLPDYKSNYFDASNACHETYTGAIQNPNEIAARAYSLTFPAAPDTTSQAMRGAVVGLALNGVPIFGNFAAPGDDIYQEARTFDRCGAHPQEAGAYHYHAEPYAISYNDANFIGVMRDGYPIYGRRDPDGSLPTLDSFGGHTGVTADSPSTPVYHYHVNEQTSTNAGTNGEKQWFLTTGTFRGTPGTCSGCN